MLIPKNCIKTFKSRYMTYPSILEKISTIESSDNIEKYFSKYMILWRKEFTNDDDTTRVTDKLIDYDSTGIMVYIKEERHIFILTTESRMDVAKLTLSRLKKILKENGNNSRTTETKN